MKSRGNYVKFQLAAQLVYAQLIEAPARGPARLIQLTAAQLIQLAAYWILYTVYNGRLAMQGVYDLTVL
jgi:hypothetical protein